jgi:hypothetical protein
MPYFLLSFTVPEDARAGTYKGTMEIRYNQKTRTIPLTLRVQDLSLPVIRDKSIGMIFQGNVIPFNDEGLTQYAKSGFTSVVRFGGFFKYKREGGEPMVDLDDLKKKLEWLKGYGITASVCPFTDFDLGPIWSGGTLYKLVKGDKSKFQREVKRVEDFVKANPDLPIIIYMSWDEPIPGQPYQRGKHGGSDPRMGWIPEVVGDALHGADIHFFAFRPNIIKYYNMPILDNPPHFIGPELYRWLKAQGKSYGICGMPDRGEAFRYQLGMLMIASDSVFYHNWHLGHLGKLMKVENGKVLRSISMVAGGEGMDDFKIHRLLTDLIRKAKSSRDAAKTAVAREAEAYLESIRKIRNGDVSYIGPYQCRPYLGYAAEWGNDRFYGQWQESMAKFAARLAGVKWIAAGGK